MAKRGNKKQKLILGIIGIVIIAILSLIGVKPEILKQLSEIAGLNIQFEETAVAEPQVEFVAEDNLKVYFIDVGQADSILLINKNETMLIDAGNNEDGQDVVNFIKEKGITKLNYLVGTHPHEDHIGGLDDVINSLEIENIFMPKIETTTRTFEDILDAIENKSLKVTAPKKGDTFKIGDANCEIMTDSILDKDNLNLSSIVIRTVFGNNSFLFMGDSETENEKTIQWPKTDVLKLGHHGSSTSTSAAFLKQVQPSYAVIMAGKDNSYGLPKSTILNRIKEQNAVIYRTDENGTIQMISDGNKIEIELEKNT